MTPIDRRPAGTPAGGQFTTTPRCESDTRPAQASRREHPRGACAPSRHTQAPRLSTSPAPVRSTAPASPQWSTTTAEPLDQSCGRRRARPVRAVRRAVASGHPRLPLDRNVRENCQLSHSSTGCVVTRILQAPAGTFAASMNFHDTRSLSPSSSLKPRQPLSAGDTSIPARLYCVLTG